MQKHLLSSCLVFLFIWQYAFAQQPVCISNTAPSVDLCPDACVYCSLTGFTGTTSGFTEQDPPGGFCGTIENEQWVAFVAVSTTAQITATPSNCQNGNGVQIALYSSCTSEPVGCDGGNQGFANVPVTITVDLVPGQTYFLMIDGYAGDVCDFTLSMTPPSAGSAYVTSQEILLCSGETYTIDGVAYTAPNTIPVILAENGDCDSILVYNLLAVTTAFPEETLVLCQDESVVLNGQTYFAPDTISFNYSGSTGCDSVQTYFLLLKEYNYLAKTVFLCPGEPVIVAGVAYTEAGIVRDTLPGTTSCDTVITYTLQYILDPADCPSCSPTFLQTIGFEGQEVRGHGIYPSPDGYLYVTGSKQDSSLLLKITPAGTIVWMRTFDFLPGQDEHMAELLVDSEGMLAGCGRSDTAQADYTGFAFRYNPDTDALLWARRFTDATPDVNGMIQAIPGSNYIIYYRQNTPQYDAGIVEITKNDGSFVFGNLSKTFDNGGVDNFSSMITYDGSLIASGTYTGFGAAIHNGLTRIGLGGSVVFAFESHIHDDSTSILNGRDVLGENNAIYSVSSGNTKGYDQNNNTIFLQRNNIFGNLGWIKKIDLQGTTGEIVDEIVSVPDGFVLYCRSLTPGSSVFYLVKTDKLGNLQWSKKLDYAFNPSLLSTTSIQSQILLKGDYLYAVSTVSDTAGHDRLMLLKMRGDATIDGDCAFLSEAPVSITTVSNPVTYSVFSAQNPVALNAFAEQPIPVGTALTTKQACEVFIQTQINLTFCAGQSVVIDGVSYNQSGTVMDTLPGISCDTIVTYQLNVLNQYLQTDTLQFCPGESVTIDGIVYNQSATIVDTIPSSNGCDTILTYVLVLQPQPVLTETITLCPGESVTIDGIVYNQSGTVVDTIPAVSGCDTIKTYTLDLLIQAVVNETITFCPGESVTIGGVVYNQSGTVTDTIPGTAGCDTIATYTLVLLPQPLQTETITLCPGGSVNIGGIDYNQAGTVIDTLSGTTGCDTIVTYTLVLAPQPLLTETFTFCPGESITIAGVVYNQSGVVTDTIPGTAGCDTIATYTLVLLPQPLRTETIAFCLGESVTIDGITYSQPGTVVDTLPASSGCDTILTYTLEYLTTPNSAVSVSCPGNVNIVTAPNAGPVNVDYNLPLAVSDCECPGIALTLTQGFAPGSDFPAGTTAVRYTAQDSCGNTTACCFNVVVSEEEACDIKVIGCMKYELLSITKNAGSDFTYRIRVTNNCTNKMIYTAIQLPDGVTALEPAQHSVYTAPGGREYDVRNPNFSPVYSIRFKSKTDSIANGQSDVFEYVLPGQAPPSYIHVVSRLNVQVFYEAHLNTFYCPVGVTPANRDNASSSGNSKSIKLYPNPTTGVLYADLSAWHDETVQVQVFDSRGLRVQAMRLAAGEGLRSIQLAEGLANGLYFLDLLTEGGERRFERFVLQR